MKTIKKDPEFYDSLAKLKKYIIQSIDENTVFLPNFTN